MSLDIKIQFSWNDHSIIHNQLLSGETNEQDTIVAISQGGSMHTARLHSS
jgi:hypothetical protein